MPNLKGLIIDHLQISGEHGILIWFTDGSRAYFGATIDHDIDIEYPA